MFALHATAGGRETVIGFHLGPVSADAVWSPFDLAVRRAKWRLEAVPLFTPAPYPERFGGGQVKPAAGRRSMLWGPVIYGSRVKVMPWASGRSWE